MVKTRHIVPADRIRLIPGSGVRTDLFDRTSVNDAHVLNTRSKLGIDGDSLIVIMIARLVRSKGVFDYVQAAQIVRQTTRAIHFLLVGPWDQGSADRLSQDEVNSFSKNVSWLGERRDIAVLLALSDICVMPLYREGISRVLMEGAAMGLPLVATDMPGCREVVDDGVNGFLVPARDSAALASSIIKLANDGDLRRRFGLASRDIAVGRFDTPSITRQVKEVYGDSYRAQADAGRAAIAVSMWKND